MLTVCFQMILSSLRRCFLQEGVIAATQVIRPDGVQDLMAMKLCVTHVEHVGSYHLQCEIPLADSLMFRLCGAPSEIGRRGRDWHFILTPSGPWATGFRPITLSEIATSRNTII